MWRSQHGLRGRKHSRARLCHTMRGCNEMQQIVAGEKIVEKGSRRDKNLRPIRSELLHDSF